MKEVIQINNSNDLSMATSLLLAMGYTKISDDVHCVTFAKEGGMIVLEVR